MTYVPQINNNQYAALAGEGDNEYNDTKSTGVENNGKITVVRHDDKTTGVGSDNKSTELGITVATDEAYELALVEEAISETEQDIAEGPDLLVGTEIETEEARNENVIHLDFQVPTVEHT